MHPSKKTRLSRDVLTQVARRFRALADPTRLALIQELCDGERTVSQLCETLGISQANTSKQLGSLAQAGILARRKQGVYAYYRLADPSITELCTLVCGSLLRHHEEIRDTMA